MGDVINFRKAKKAIARTDEEKQASENRITFGRTRAEKTLAEARAEKAARLLDGHKRTETPKDDEPA